VPNTTETVSNCLQYC